MSVGELREQFAEALNEVKYGNGRTIVKRHGKKVAAVISIEDLELLEHLEDIIDRRAIKEAEAEIEAHGTVSFEDVLKELGMTEDDLRDQDDKKSRKGSAQDRG